MGCFIACLRSSDDVKRRKQRRRKVLPRDQGNPISKPVQASPSAVDIASDKSISPILKARDRHEEHQLSPSPRKRVTFDSNVKTYELDHVEAEVSFDKKEYIKGEKELSELPQCKSHSEEDGPTVSSVSSYPPNHRYQNCRESDDEDELDYSDSDLVDTDGDGDEKDYDDIEYEEYDYFSDDESGTISVGVFADEVDSSLSVCGCPGKSESQLEVRWISQDSNARVPSVLKPVENISQWKAVKVKDKHQPNPPSRKENSTLNGSPYSSFGTEPSCKEPSFGYKSKASQPMNSDQGIAVDASLSNWLSSTEVTSPSKCSISISSLPTPEPQGSISSKSQKDKPILGALTMEELGSPSPRRSPKRSPDEMPIIGTVGMHWSHSGSVEDFGPVFSFERMSNSSSNYREMCVK